MNKFYITEDIAEKLQAKGYPYSHIIHFDNGVPIARIDEVLDWLREEKDVFIGLEYINQEACGCTIIRQKTGGLIAKWDWDKFNYANKNPLVGNTYEAAALAGIEYVIDNLI